MALMVATPRGALLAALAAAGRLGPGLACDYEFDWHGSICPRTRFSVMSPIAPGCCRGSQVCPTLSAKHVAGTDRVTPSDPSHPRTCDCGITPDRPDPCAPTCSDRIHNGDEIAIDCGGSCPTCPCTPAPLAMDRLFLQPTRVVNIPSRPQCVCLSQGGGFRCPPGNTVDHWTCMYDCGNGTDSAAFCREKKHFHTDATGLGVCEHVSQLPDVAL
eukprot:COSAG01_NODE_20386_length_956_cov_163.179697_1_plen_214_part_10